MEYLILLGVMTIVALLSFRTLIPGALTETNQRFNSAAASILGNQAIISINGPWPTEQSGN